jgi:GNAT superfamily N-acetyltransferase
VASWTIRRATIADVDGIVSCLHAAFEPYRADYTHGAFNDTVLTIESCAARLREMCILVARGEDESVVGTIACQRVSPEEGHVRGMAVLPQYHGRGVAEALLAAAEAELRAQKCQRVTLDTTKYLLRAMCFYERNGYAATGRLSDFFGMTLIEYAKTI